MPKIMRIYYDNAGYPYKDSALSVRYPIVEGNEFTGANNTTEVHFYTDNLGQATWVANCKLPNNELVNRLLVPSVDEDGNTYQKLLLDRELTNFQGHLKIGLNGYAGNISIDEEELDENNIVVISGTPTIIATGIVDIAMNYSPIVIPLSELTPTEYQELLAIIGTKLNITKGIYVIDDITNADYQDYALGQIFYDKESHLFYQRTEAGFVKENIDIANLEINGETLSTVLQNIVSTFDSYYNKTQTDTFLNGKVDKTDVANKVYGTDENGNQTTIDVDDPLVGEGSIVRRVGSGGQVIVGNPQATNHATPKSYVDAFAKDLVATINNTTYVMTLVLKDKNGNALATQSIDLPLESIVTSATYYDSYTYEETTYTKVVVLILSTTDVPTIIPVGDLVSGLVSATDLATALANYYTKAQIDTMLSSYYTKIESDAAFVPQTRKIASLTLEQDISRDELNDATGLGDIIVNHTFLNKKNVIVTGTSTYVYKDFDFLVDFVETTKVSLHIDNVVGKTSNPYAYLYALDNNDQTIEYLGLYNSAENNTISLNCTTSTKKIRIRLYPASGTAMPTGSATYTGVTVWYGDTPIYIGDNAKYPRLDSIEANTNLIPEIIQDNSYIYKKDIVVSGNSTYVYKNFEFDVDLSQPTDFSLHFDSVVGNSQPLCAFIYARDENNETITFIGLYYGTTPNNTVTLTCPTNTKKVVFTLYPARGTAMPTGSATFSGVTAWKGEYPVFIKDSAGYPRLDRVEKQVGILVGANQYHTTIQSAVNAAKDGQTILIENGTYNEAVKLCGSTGSTYTSAKNLTLKGFNRDACILTYSVGDYDNPPLEIAVGVVENLTIQTTGYEHSEGSNQYAYCVHIDFGTGANKCIEFRNCRFKGTMYPCVGLGIRQGQKVTFTNCIFECEQSAAMLFHETQQSNVADAYIEFNNCTFISGNQYNTIHVQETSEYVGNNVNVTFMRCIVKNTNNGQLVRLYDLSGHAGEGDKWLNSTRFTLTPISDLNSNEIFDYD